MPTVNYQSGLRKLGTMANIRMISDTLDARARSAIDIGCDAGAYSVHLANLGLKVDAFDPDDVAVGAAREFIASNQSPVKLTHQLFTLEDVRKMPVYDVSLLLSVYHQIVEHNGLEYANEYLVELYRRTRHQLYFQSCMIHLKHRRKMPFIENHTPSILAYFTEVLRKSGQPIYAQMLGYSQNQLPASEPFRPMFVFEKNRKREIFTLPSMERGGCAGGCASEVLVVDLDQAVSDQTLTSFGRGGWHHFTAACQELHRGGASARENAQAGLKAYYQRFQPKSYADTWRSAGLTTDIGVMAKQPTRRACSWLPWNPCADSPADMQAGVTIMHPFPPHDCHAYGPVTADVIASETDRLQGLMARLAADGYEPEINHDGYIRGQLLVRDGVSRFLVTAGQHRIAALSALGYQQIMARFQPGRPKVVDLATVERWPLVANGTYTVAQARAIFEGVFEATGLALREALRERTAIAPIALPTPRSYQLAASRENGWSDQYGSVPLAAQYAGTALEAGYRLNAIWHHGCEGPWVDFSPALLTNNTPNARNLPVLVARKDQEQLLRSAGYADARAIGLPIIYTKPSNLPRQPRSLLVMPTHTLAGEQPSDRSAFERYAEEIRAIAGDFDRVTICVHPSCRQNGLWVKEFSVRGFEIFEGAQNTDLHALTRMRMLFEQCETMTTNGWGSHVAYALAFGAKVAIYGTQPKRTQADYLRDATWAADPAALKQWLSDESNARERAFLASYYQAPAEAVANVEQGRALIGWENRLEPEAMRELLGTILESPATAARQARGVVRTKARELAGAGAKAEAIQLLIRAAKADVASKNPTIIFESLVEIGDELAPLEPRQSTYLLGEAEKIAKTSGVSVAYVRARLAAA